MHSFFFYLRVCIMHQSIQSHDLPRPSCNIYLFIATLKGISLPQMSGQTDGLRGGREEGRRGLVFCPSFASRASLASSLPCRRCACVGTGILSGSIQRWVVTCNDQGCSQRHMKRVMSRTTRWHSHSILIRDLCPKIAFLCMMCAKVTWSPYFTFLQGTST